MTARRGWLAILALLPALAGCVTVEGTLRADGSCTLDITYRSPPDATEFLERRQYTSPFVHPEYVKIFESQRTVVRATVDDVTRLSTAPAFAFVDVVRSRDGADEVLQIRIRNPKPQPVPAERTSDAWMRIGLTLPGRVRDATHDGQVAGTHVAWDVAKSDYVRSAATVLSVRWQPSATP